MVRWVLWVGLLCGCRLERTDADEAPPPAPPPVLVEAMAGVEGLAVVLGDASPAPVEAAPSPTPTPLSASRTRSLLSRLEPIAEDIHDDRKTFRLRKSTAPMPRTARTVDHLFPPAEGPPAPRPPAAGPVEVVRFSPEGEVADAANLALTFDQPMVAVTAVDTVAAHVPVVLDPQPPGQWRWVGTRTVVFEADAGFPKATHYRVEVPRGTRSARDGLLEEDFRWSFSTPPPVLVAHGPTGGPTARQPELWAVFDQTVDAPTVLKHTRLSTPSGASWPVELAAPSEGLARALEGHPPERVVVFRPSRTLPADTPLTVTVGAGLPSAEGPRLTETDAHWVFVTHGPLQVVEVDCPGDCEPEATWTVHFTNPLDGSSLAPGDITVRPPAELTGSAWARRISLAGVKAPDRSHTVTLPDTLRDVFGQPLSGKRTFSVRTAPFAPRLSSPARHLAILDPMGPAVLPVFAFGTDRVRIRIYRVQVDAYLEVARWIDDGRPGGVRTSPPSAERVLDAERPVRGARDRVVELSIDLEPYLVEGHGQFVVVVTHVPRVMSRTVEIVHWVQRTDLGVSAFTSSDGVLAWISDLAGGRPIEGAEVHVMPGDATATTDGDGLATLRLSDTPAERYLTVRRGADSAVLPAVDHAWHSYPWMVPGDDAGVLWYAADDRGVYRPGESVHLKGWVRHRSGGPAGDLTPVAPEPVHWEATGPRGKSWGRGDLTPSELGGFDLAFTIPPEANLGAAAVTLSAHFGSPRVHAHRHTFRVEEFRRPEFEVDVAVSPGPHVLGTHLSATVDATYFAGGGLGGAPVTWVARSAAGTYTPPGHPGFHFGAWRPWWAWLGWRAPGSTSEATTYVATADARGHHALEVHLAGMDAPHPTVLTLEASVTDLSGQLWATSAQALIHPADRYVGLRADAVFVDPGEAVEISAIVTDIDGTRIARVPMDIRLAGPAGEQTCPLLSAATEGTCTFRPEEPGSHLVTAHIVDAHGRPNSTSLRVWVSGAASREAAGSDQVEVIPDRARYAPGDVAEILVRTPFVPAEALVTWRRSGLLHRERRTLTASDTTISVPIEDAYTPNLVVQVDVVGSRPRDLDPMPADAPPRPAWASGHVGLVVDTRERALTVDITPREVELLPGGETRVDLRVTDARGAAVKDAEVALVAVDEAVLALTGHRLGDPLNALYAHRNTQVVDRHNRPLLLLAWFGEGPAPMGTRARNVLTREFLKSIPAGRSYQSATSGAPKTPIRIRKDFAALALFAPQVRTRSDGTATTTLSLPDSVTRYRLMAVAAHGATSFGGGETTVLARKPLMVRPSPPRFLNFGDRAEVAVLVQNQTRTPRTVDVALRTSNAVVTGPAGYRVEVPAEARAEVRFAVGTDMAGTARLQAAVASGTFADAVELSLPVWTPATTEAFATYGQIDAGAIVQPVQAPAGAFSQYGALQISTSSTAVSELTDAVAYLYWYPYACTEQRASRVLALAALRDVLTAFGSGGLPAPEAVESRVQRDLTALAAMQRDDGAFGFWRRTQEAHPYVSIHVLHALARAKEKGFTVADATVERGLTWLQGVPGNLDPELGEDHRRHLEAYALYVRHLHGDVGGARARILAATDLPLEAQGWVAHVLAADGADADVDRLVRQWMNRVSETAGAAHFVTEVTDDGRYLLLQSARRTDGVLLEALVALRPDSDLVPKLVRGLLAHRVRGRWDSTQENGLVLVGLDAYFRRYESVTPDFVAQAWLGSGHVGRHAFTGRSTDQNLVEVPLGYLTETREPQDLLLTKEGPGRMYYRIGLTWAPRNLMVAPVDRGFEVKRRYEGIDDPADVHQEADGTWVIREGARVRATVTMVSPGRRVHVALVDPLPAGLEAVNPRLAGTPDDTRDLPWWWRTWYEHANLRDERAEAFTSLLWAGEYTYSHELRATTPGTFVVPPPKAEEMYNPETFGRGATDRVIVRRGSS